jgi:hypothetical protein
MECDTPYSLVDIKDRAIAHSVSRWLPTAAAWVRARVRLNGICGGQSGAGSGFLRVLRFPLANLYSTKFSILTATRGRYNRPDLVWIPHPAMRIKKKVGKYHAKT